MFAWLQTPISDPSSTGGLPTWLYSGPVPVILLIATGIVLIFVWLNFRLNRIQRDLHVLGKSYYEKDRSLIDNFKAGLITEKEYRREHERLVREMREDSRRMTDGPP